jgi:hypothetical protein
MVEKSHFLIKPGTRMDELTVYGIYTSTAFYAPYYWLWPCTLTVIPAEANIHVATPSHPVADWHLAMCLMASLQAE